MDSAHCRLALRIRTQVPQPGTGRRADRDGRGGEQATRRASSHLVTPHAPSLKRRFAIRVGASLTVTADRLFFLTRRAAAAPQRSALLIVSMKATRHARGDHTDINCIFTILSTAPLARCGTRTRGRVCTMRHYEVMFHDSSRRRSIRLGSLAAGTGNADKRGNSATFSVGTKWLCSACN